MRFLFLFMQIFLSCANADFMSEKEINDERKKTVNDSENDLLEKEIWYNSNYCNYNNSVKIYNEIPNEKNLNNIDVKMYETKGYELIKLIFSEDYKYHEKLYTVMLKDNSVGYIISPLSLKWKISSSETDEGDTREKRCISFSNYEEIDKNVEEKADLLVEKAKFLIGKEVWLNTSHCLFIDIKYKSKLYFTNGEEKIKFVSVERSKNNNSVYYTVELEDGKGEAYIRLNNEIFNEKILKIYKGNNPTRECMTYIGEKENRIRVAKLPKPRIGMTKQQALKTNWGIPLTKNYTKEKYGISEQWVFHGGNYLYFSNGKLSTIQGSELFE